MQSAVIGGDEWNGQPGSLPPPPVLAAFHLASVIKHFRRAGAKGRRRGRLWERLWMVSEGRGSLLLFFLIFFFKDILFSLLFNSHFSAGFLIFGQFPDLFFFVRRVGAGSYQIDPQSIVS